MDEPRHGTIVSGEVIPPQTYLHKVAAAKRDDAADDDGAESTDAPESPEATTADTTDETAPADHEDTESTADTVTMPASSAASDAPADTGESHAAWTDTAAPDTADPDIADPDTTDPDPARIHDEQAGILDTDAARASGAPDDAASHTTRPDIVAPEAPGAAQPREGRPGDVPVPADVSLIGDGVAIRERWMSVQASFVDDPRAAVSAAAGVITDAAARVETAVRERQQALRDRWDSEGRSDTEELRVTMQQYRQLLERLAAL